MTYHGKIGQNHIDMSRCDTAHKQHTLHAAMYPGRRHVEAILAGISLLHTYARKNLGHRRHGLTVRNNHAASSTRVKQWSKQPCSVVAELQSLSRVEAPRRNKQTEWCNPCNEIKLVMLSRMCFETQRRSLPPHPYEQGHGAAHW